MRSFSRYGGLPNYEPSCLLPVPKTVLLVPGLLLAALVWNPRANYAGIFHLVKQRPVADLQGSGVLPAIPAVLLEGLQNDLALQLPRCLFRYLLERQSALVRIRLAKCSGNRIC